jgi:biotin carboxyl carrier protein
VDLRRIDGQRFSLLLDSISYEIHVERHEGTYYVMLEGDRYAVEVADARLKHVREMGLQEHALHGLATVLAPMPGLVVRLLVTPGAEVVEGQGVAILEAMKMENEIRAPRAGVVKAVHVHGGMAVNQGDTLVVVGDADPVA